MPLTSSPPKARHEHHQTHVGGIPSGAIAETAESYMFGFSGAITVQSHITWPLRGCPPALCHPAGTYPEEFSTWEDFLRL